MRIFTLPDEAWQSEQTTKARQDLEARVTDLQHNIAAFEADREQLHDTNPAYFHGNALDEAASLARLEAHLFSEEAELRLSIAEWYKQRQSDLETFKTTSYEAWTNTKDELLAKLHNLGWADDDSLLATMPNRHPVVKKYYLAYGTYDSTADLVRANNESLHAIAARMASIKNKALAS